MNLFNKMMVPAFAAALTIGASVASQAQNFTFTNVFSANTFTSGSSTLSVSNGLSVPSIGAPTTIILGNIAEFTTPGGGPNTFTAANGSYSSVLTLVDTASGQSLSRTFSGVLTGTADGGAAPSGTGASANIANTFVTPSAAPSLTFAFASGTYTVNTFQFLPPQPQTAIGAGPSGFAAFVNYTAVPEPGAVAMMVGMGITGAGFLTRRRRK